MKKLDGIKLEINHVWMLFEGSIAPTPPPPSVRQGCKQGVEKKSATEKGLNLEVWGKKNKNNLLFARMNAWLDQNEWDY